MAGKFVVCALLAVCALGAQIRRPIKIGSHFLDLSTRIVYGEDAAPGEFPYQISLQQVILGIPSHVCGGSILNENYILSAGHCITETIHLGHFRIVAGTNDIKGTLPATAQVRRVAETTVHPDYPGGVAANDLSILKLESPLEFTELIQPISLPEADSIPEGTVVLSGWGSINPNDTTGLNPVMPDVLQKAELPIVPFDQCQEIWGTDSPLVDTNVCTGPVEGGSSPCNGDSGGPLAQQSENGSVIIGIVSWGNLPCGSPNSPAVYTRVSAFVDWIEAQISA